MSTIDSNPDGSNPAEPEPEIILLIKEMLDELHKIRKIVEERKG